MKELKYGAVTVVLPDSVQLPARAGKMSKKEVSRLLKAPHGMKLAAEQTAVALQTAGAQLSAPPGITPELLLSLCNGESEALESIIVDLLYLLVALKQGKLLVDAKLHSSLLQLKDIVRAQAKYNPQLSLMFAPLLALFEKSSVTRKKRAAASRKADKEALLPSETIQAHPEKAPLNLVKLSEVAS
jgi:hypothetical protein